MKTAKILSHGNSQSVILPEEIHFGGDEVCIIKSGEAVFLFPKEKAYDTMDSRPDDIFSKTKF